MQLKSILRLTEPIKGFVYKTVNWDDDAVIDKGGLLVTIAARRGSRATCSGCGIRRSSYDHLSPRRWNHVPLWGLPVVFLYALRRVNCPHCGVVVERIPWAEGKQQQTSSFRWFLARWAKRLSWRETAKAFLTSWDTVYRSVAMAVEWGLAHRVLDNIRAIGIDEIAWKTGKNKFLTLVYQIDSGGRRLLWIGAQRKRRTLASFFRWFGAVRCKALKYIATDMWKAYITESRKWASGALHVLDRFHVVKNLNQAVDEIRRDETRAAKKAGYETELKNSRWCLLKRRGNLTRKQSIKLKELLKYNLKTVKGYLLKEHFQRIWKLKSPRYIATYFNDWIEQVKASGLTPMKRVATTLEKHVELLFNWFETKGEISNGAVEGMNNKVKLTTRRSYGFKSEEVLKTPLFHNLGRLPEPAFTHKYCE